MDRSRRLPLLGLMALFADIGATCSPAYTYTLHSNIAPLFNHPQAAQQSQGIQTLLEAEKEAAKIVQKARTCECASGILESGVGCCGSSGRIFTAGQLGCGGTFHSEPGIMLAQTLTRINACHCAPSDRTQKLKDARNEAAKEIEELKSKKDNDFQKFKKEVSSVRGGK